MAVALIEERVRTPPPAYYPKPLLEDGDCFVEIQIPKATIRSQREEVYLGPNFHGPNFYRAVAQHRARARGSKPRNSENGILCTFIAIMVLVGVAAAIKFGAFAN